MSTLTYRVFGKKYDEGKKLKPSGEQELIQWAVVMSATGRYCNSLLAWPAKRPCHYRPTSCDFPVEKEENELNNRRAQ